MRWDHQFQFAGYYAAKWQGYYKAAGFDVDIRSALKPDGTILKTVKEVVVSSGFGEVDITSKIPREQIAGMINKPYRFDQLRDVIRGVVESP